tara:strand:- start:11880 stop:12380 length:501 start_codon:yes stop_codon:yes gene_type:complete
VEETTNQKLQQLNISYNANEDRLLFKVSAGGHLEYRLWFTRRFTRILLKLLMEKMNAYGGVDTIAVSEDTQQAIKKGAFEKKYIKLDEPEYPLGEAGITPTKMKVSELPNKSLNVQFMNNANKGMNLNMDKKMLFMMHNLLIQGLARAEWNLNLEQSLAANARNVH